MDYRFEKQVDDEHQKIPPLLFITFVENAFKHGIEPAEGNCFLHIFLESTQEGLIFTCENSLEANSVAPAGIGLTNLKRRMELKFPNQHNIHTEVQPTHFKATLQINY